MNVCLNENKTQLIKDIMSQRNGGDQEPPSKRLRGIEDFDHLSNGSSNTSQFDSSCDFDAEEVNLLQSRSPCQVMPLKLVKREDHSQDQNQNSQLNPSEDEDPNNGVDDFEENTANDDDEFGEDCEEEDDDQEQDSEEEGATSSQLLSEHHSLLQLMPELLANSVSALPALVLPSLLSRLQVT